MTLRLLVLALTALASIAAAASSSADLVIELNDANFDRLLTEHAPMLVEFYAPWCGHCQALEPEYKLAAEQLAALPLNKVKLGKVDASHENSKELAQKFGIQGFPTLKFLYTADADVKPVDYEGERNAQSIVKYCLKRSSPAVQLLDSAAAVSAFAARQLVEDDKIVFGYFPLKEHMVAFTKQANGDDAREYVAVVGSSAETAALLSKLQIEQAEAPVVAVLRGFNASHPVVSTGEARIVSSQQELAKYITQSLKPFSHVEAYSADDVAQAKLAAGGVHLVEFYAPWCGYCQQFAPEYEKVALHFAGKGGEVKVANLDGTVYEAVLGQEQVEGFPTTKLYRNGASTTYKGGLTAAEVIQFVQDKLQAKTELVADLAAFTTFAASAKDAQQHQVALVLCSVDDQVADQIAFEFGSPNFKVGRVQCSGGKDKVAAARLYSSSESKNGGLVSSLASVQGGHAELRKWVKRASIPKVFMFEDDLLQQVQEAEFKYLFLAISNKDQVPDEVKKAMADAADLPEVLDTAFAFADSSADYMLEFFGLKQEDLPAVRILEIQTPEMTNYAGPQGAFSAADLAQSYRDLVAGKLEALSPPQQQNEEAYAEAHDADEDEVEAHDADDDDVEEGDAEDLEEEKEEL